MKKIIPLLLMASCLLASPVILAQKLTSYKAIPESVIKQSILAFANLIDSQNIKKFGLNNKEQLKSLKSGRQFTKYFIGLDDIRKYKAGDDVEKIIKKYPVVEVALVDGNGKIFTSIEFDSSNNNWRAIGYGLTPELNALRRAQDSIGKKVIEKGELIRIPALQTSFIAITSAGRMQFIVLKTNPYLKLVKGDKLSSSNAILRLVPLALQREDIPD